MNDMSDKALVFNIQRYCIHDGPGIRTLVFFKGCSVKCKWCSNPEGIESGIQIKYIKQKCRGCAACQSCPQGAVSCDPVRGFIIDRDKCTACGYCVKVCPASAREVSGRYLEVTELFEKVRRDAAFYQSSQGGVTLGGGDPILQKASVSLLRLCRENGLHTAIETAGNYDFNNLREAAQYCDTIMFDIKGWDEARHMECTGVKPGRIRNNLMELNRWITDSGRDIPLIVRIPLKPGFNFTPEDFIPLADWLAGLENLEKVEILPIHHLGSNKYEQIGLSYPMGDPDNVTNIRAEEVSEYAQALIERGLKVVVART